MYPCLFEHTLFRERRSTTLASTPSQFCPQCGISIRPGQKFCINCGKVLEEGAYQATAMASNTPPPPPPNLSAGFGGRLTPPPAGVPMTASTQADDFTQLSASSEGTAMSSSTV